MTQYATYNPITGQIGVHSNHRDFAELNITDEFSEIIETNVEDFNASTYKVINSEVVLDSDLYNEELANKIRSERNQKLKETDWRFRSDLTPSQAWIDYCQNLRDIPSQTGFPSNITWPTPPE